MYLQINLTNSDKVNETFLRWAEVPSGDKITVAERIIKSAKIEADTVGKVLNLINSEAFKKQTSTMVKFD